MLNTQRGVVSLQPQIILHLSSKQQGTEPQNRKTPQPIGSTVEQSQATISSAQPIVITPSSRSDSQIKFPLIQAGPSLGQPKSISPLKLGKQGLVTTRQTMSERVNGWGGVSISFLDLAVDLGIFFADLKKWSFAADRGRWKVVDTPRFILAIDGVIQ